MPDEYVVAQHEFVPDHDDEIEFKVGELIFVVEKDDQYGDGWWQGRNSAGKTGLFPQSYTKLYDPLAVPEAKAPSTLGPLAEEEENTAEPSSTSRPTSPQHQPVMHATLSDVQQAIEQLAVRRDTDTDAGRSFSFVSTNGAETEPDTEEEGEYERSPGGAQDFRKTLAERAKKVNQRKALEQPDPTTTDPVGSALGFLRRRSSSTSAIAPPISVELSDESDADDEDEDEEAMKKRHEHDVHPHHHKYRSSTSTAIKMVDTPTDTAIGTPRQIPDSLPPPPDATVVEPPALAAPRPQTPITATASGFSSLSEFSQRQLQATAKPSFATELPASLPSSSPTPAATMPSANIPLPTSPSPAGIVNVNGNGVSSSHVPLAQVIAPVQQGEERAAATQKNSIPATITPALTPTPEMPAQTLAPTLTYAQFATPVSSLPADSDPFASLKRIHPSEWTVNQVVIWLKSKNVDEATCAKFVEQEITGDVLLELDVNLLKEEMGITVLGKRMRIANAIVELKRPASFSSEPANMPLPMSQASSVMGGGFVGTQNGYVGSPLPTAGNADQYPFSFPNVVSPSLNGKRVLSDEGSASVVSVGDESLKVPKSRPAQLTLSSPSDGALNTKVPAQITEEGAQEITKEERSVQSENETPATSSTFPSRRRRFLGLSTESNSSRGSKERKSTELTSIPNSPALRGDKDMDSNKSARVSMEDKTSVGKHIKGKRSLDAGKSNGFVGSERGGGKSTGGDRLSFFGATLGKSRKPPPRYSIYDDSNLLPAAPAEKSSRSISRFMTSGKKSARPGTAPSTAAGVVPFGSGSKDDTHTHSGSVRDPALLRKRHISTSGPISPPLPTGSNITSAEAGQNEVAEVGENGEVQFRPGQSVLDQIGEPDHAGWLRKKGERYNSWKLRYLVLRGSHLYYLRSNSRTETKIKGYIPVHGYKVVVDENLNPGKYGFRLVHETQPAHFFCSDEQPVIREWMKALMKATIDRDYSKPVVSSCNVPTIPLSIAQTMSPAPRPPSPTARDATQRALRRENPNQLSSRDAKILMGLPGGNENGNGDSTNFFTYNVENVPNGQNGPTPPRPSRISRTPSLSNRPASVGSAGTATIQTHGRAGSVDRMDSHSDGDLIEWANSLLPKQYRIYDVTRDLTSGLVLLRLAESIKGSPSEPPVSDSLFKDENNIDGMFKLFDYLLDNDVKMESVSINDIKQGRRDKTTQLLKSLRYWHEKRKALAKSIGKGAGVAGPWMAMEAGTSNW